MSLSDDGTRENRVHRDGQDTGRGSSQTHGAGDPSGVDAEADPIPNPDAEALPPSAATG